MNLFKQTAVYGAGSVAARSVSFSLIPVYTHYLAPADYGEVALAYLFLSIVHHLFNYGLHVAFVKDFVQAEGGQPRRSIFSTAVLSNLVTGTFFLLALWFLTPVTARLLSGDPAMRRALYFGVAALFLDGLSFIPMLTLRALEKPGAYSLASVFAAVVSLLIQCLMIMVYGRGWTGVFYGQFGASAATLLVCLPVYLRYLRLDWKRDLFLRMARFGLPYLTVTLSILLIDMSDRYLLKYFTDLDTVGIYSLGYRLALIVSLWITAFYYAWPPYFLKMLKEPGGADHIAARLRETFTSWVVFWLAFNLFLGPVLTLEWRGASLVSPAYRAGLPLIPLLSLAYILYGLYMGLMVGVYAKEKSGWLNIISAAGLAFNLLGNILLIPWAQGRAAGGGMWAAAATTAGSYLLMSLWMYFLNQRYYPLDLWWGRFFRLAAITGGFFAAACLLPAEHALLFRLPLFLAYLGLLKYLMYWRWPRRMAVYFSKNERADSGER